MENVNVNNLVKEIKAGLSQVAVSAKDEIKVMRAMLNDKDYTVGVYAKDGKVGEYSPSQEVRGMMAGVLTSTTRISASEADALMNEYEFKRQDASTMVDLSKEFFNTYMQTGRKVGFGGRENSDVYIGTKQVKPSERKYPKKIGVDDSGEAIYDRLLVKVPGYESVKVYPTCPKWVQGQ